MNEGVVRDQVQRLLDWGEAHAPLDKAMEGIPPELRGRRVEGFPHSLWEILEHIRIAQRDILDYCREDDYRELDWPRDYWPDPETSPDEEAWSESIRKVLEDRAMLQALALDPRLDLSAGLPRGRGTSYLRCLLLAADHAAYHVGQMVMLRRMLGNWEDAAGA
jgi:uncharacterized damage-inducible protein DinB